MKQPWQTGQVMSKMLGYQSYLQGTEAWEADSQTLKKLATSRYLLKCPVGTEACS